MALSLESSCSAFTVAEYLQEQICLASLGLNRNIEKETASTRAYIQRAIISNKNLVLEKKKKKTFKEKKPPPPPN